MNNWSLDYVRRVLAQTGMTATALAGKAGVSSTTLTRPLNSHEHTYSISIPTLNKIRDATGIPFDEGTRSSIPNLLTDHLPALVPVYDVAASAGPGAYVDYDVVTEKLAFPPDYLRRITSTSPDRLAIITVKGDSMEPTLKDGDIVMVDGTKLSHAFDGLFVLLIDGALHIKRLVRTGKPGFVLVRSDNERLYPAYEVPAEEIEIIGKVLWSGRKE